MSSAKLVFGAPAAHPLVDGGIIPRPLATIKTNPADIPNKVRFLMRPSYFSFLS
jgi:hypothetical protein